VRLRHDELHHPGFVERGHEHAAELGDDAHALGLVGRLAVETRVIDGDGRLVGEFGQDGDAAVNGRGLSGQPPEIAPSRGRGDRRYCRRPSCSAGGL
jgi:hypothetical protein